jgi:hypothetical protein
MKDILLIAAIVVGWLVLNRWVLPAMGIGT